MPQPINISASRGAAILGLSSWQTQVQVWLNIQEARQPGFCKKHGYVYPEFEETAAIRWGRAFESSIIELAERKQKLKIINREKLCKPVFSDYITCHIDGEYFIPKTAGVTQLHEGKTTSFFYWNDNFGEPGTDKVPMEYQVQTQHQMICTGAEKVILSVLVFPRRVEEWEEMGWRIEKEIDGNYYIYNDELTIPSREQLYWAQVLDEMGYFHQYEITAHPELQQEMIKHYSEFWNENILGEKVPDPKSYDDIKALCPEPVGTILADEKTERLIAEYKNIGEEIGQSGELAKRRNAIKVEVLNYMRNSGFVEDDESKDRWVLRSQDGKKIASYGKNKNGVLMFR